MNRCDILGAHRDSIQVTGWFCGGIAAASRWIKLPSPRESEWRFETIRSGQKKQPHRLGRIFEKLPGLYCTPVSNILFEVPEVFEPLYTVYPIHLEDNT